MHVTTGDRPGMRIGEPAPRPRGVAYGHHRYHYLRAVAVLALVGLGLGVLVGIFSALTLLVVGAVAR